MENDLDTVIANVLQESFWQGAIERNVITEAEAKLLVPLVLVTPEDMETPSYLASIIEPMQRLLDYEAKPPMERDNV